MARPRYQDLLQAKFAAGKAISVGLDGSLGRLPSDAGTPSMDAVLEFHRQLILATRHHASAYKPQSAGFEAMGASGFQLLIDTVALANELAPDVPVILDAKRADIGSTNDSYVKAAFEVIGADAITVHPYLGPEAMAPFLDQADKGVIILCRTSNPGSGHYQSLEVNGRPLYQHVAEDVATNWNRNDNCGLVVGATYPAELAEVRKLVGDMPILIPGIGAQGGDLDATVKAGPDSAGAGMLLHASRSPMYAYEQAPELSTVEATRAAIDQMQQQIEAARA